MENNRIVVKPQAETTMEAKDFFRKCGSSAPVFFLSALLALMMFLLVREAGAGEAIGCRNLIPGDSSFETGHGVWEDDNNIRPEAADGKKALEIACKAKTSATFTLKPEIPYVFSVYLKSTGGEETVMLQAYRTNWNGKYVTDHVGVTNEWKRYQLAITPQELGGHNTFWLVIAPQNGVTILADACQLEEGAEATTYVPAEPVSVFCDIPAPEAGQVFHPGEEVALALNFYNSRAEKTAITGFVSVTDYAGKTMFKKSTDLELASKENLEEKIALPEATRKGFYFVNYGFCNPEIGRVEKAASFAIVDKPVALKEGETSVFGMSSGPDRYVPVLARIGVKAQAVAARWSYDKASGTFNEEQMKRVDSQVDLRIAHGLEVTVYLRRTPVYATMKQHPHDIFPPKDKCVPDFEDFAYRVATRYKGKVRAYQLWGGEADLLANHVVNELGESREWFAQRVADLCKAGYRGLKRAEPTAMVQTTAVSGVDCAGGRFPFHRLWLPLAEGHYDEIVAHPYCYPWLFDGDKRVQSSEDSGLGAVYDEASRIAGGKPVVNGEFGFAISPNEPLDSKASMKLAAYMARSFLITAANSHARQLMYYAVAGNYDTFSIWAWPNPRPVVPAYAALAQLIEGARNGEGFAYGSQIAGFVFDSREGGSVGALYVPSGRGIEFVLAGGAQVETIDFMGNVREGGKLILGDAPVYFRSGMAKDEMKAFLLTGKAIIPPLNVTVRAPSDRKLVLYCDNQLNDELSGTLRLQVPAGNETQAIDVPFDRLRPGVTESLAVELQKPLDLSRKGGTGVSGIAETAAGEVAFAEKLETVPCNYLSPIAIDGNLDKWKDRPAFELNTTEFLFPPDAASHSLWLNAADLSVKAYVGWNEEYFYFAARVRDDVFVNANPAETLWAGDSMQLAFDPLNEELSPDCGRNVREINFAFSESENLTVVSQTRPLPVAYPQSIRAVVRVNREKGVIDYELAIPFRLLEPLAPAKGNVFGFNFVALDRDMHRVDYWMGLTYGICGGKDASLFKKFILQK
jgi:hypothetical protein